MRALENQDERVIRDVRDRASRLEQVHDRVAARSGMCAIHPCHFSESVSRQREEISRLRRELSALGHSTLQSSSRAETSTSGADYSVPFSTSLSLPSRKNARSLASSHRDDSIDHDLALSDSTSRPPRSLAQSQSAASRSEGLGDSKLAASSLASSRNEQSFGVHSGRTISGVSGIDEDDDIDAGDAELLIRAVEETNRQLSPNRK